MTTPSEIIEISATKFLWKTTGRIDLLESLVDDQFLFVHMNGRRSKKAEWMHELKTKVYTYDEITVQEVSAEVHGQTAVVVGVALFNVTHSGNPDTKHSFNLAYTEVYSLKASEWKLVALHVTAAV